MDRRTFIAASGAAAALPSLGAAAHMVDPTDTALQKPWIMPSIQYSERQTKTVEENTITIFWQVMERWTPQEDGDIKIERDFVDSDRYRQWLVEAEPFKDGIPPHIQFGGAEVSGSGDPTFKSRWVARTQLALAEGRIS